MDPCAAPLLSFRSHSFYTPCVSCLFISILAAARTRAYTRRVRHERANERGGDAHSRTIRSVVFVSISYVNSTRRMVNIAIERNEALLRVITRRRDFVRFADK